jgi:hypothetical protein
VKYFDAFLYLANWGTHVLKLRLSSKPLPLAIAEEFCGGGSAFVREKAGKVVVSFVSENEDPSDWVEGEGHLSAMVSVRDGLMRGDLRSLYLGWLLRVQSDELDNEDVEPPVPPGLGELNGPLESLADFLRIDGDLLGVAAEASPSLEDAKPRPDEFRRWVGELAIEEKDALIARLVVDGDSALGAELERRYRKERSSATPKQTTRRRTVEELFRAAEACAVERTRIEAEERAAQKVRREREAAIEREKHLDALVGSETKLWIEVEKWIAAKSPKGYDLAMRIITDLRDLAARTDDADFRFRVESLRMKHAKKPAFIDRLRKAGM